MPQRFSPPRVEHSFFAPSKITPLQPAKKAERPIGHRPTILLIDDDPAVLESLHRVLTTEGWRIITANTGEEALDRLREGEPDLMITDLRMSAVSGWDLLFHENLERPHLPIFVMTALPPDATGGADRFATQFFQKPLDLDGLIAAVRKQLC